MNWPPQYQTGSCDFEKGFFGLFLPDVTVDITWEVGNFQEPLSIRKSTALEMNVWNHSQNIKDMRFL